MNYIKSPFLPLLIAIFSLAACVSNETKQETTETDSVNTPLGQELELPEPDSTKSKVLYSNVIGWKDGKTPVAPAGFTVARFADGIKNPRWIYVAPNGDIFVALANTERTPAETAAGIISGRSKAENSGASANTIMIYRDANKDGKPELKEKFLTGLNKPFGMLIIGDSFYVANTDAVLKYPYKAGQTKMTSNGKKIVDLPAGGYNNHWTRNMISNADGSKIYITVGSGSNVGEHGMENEKRRANILEINPDGSGERIYASGLRNPAGMGWNPDSKMLWTTVNERDRIGDDLVPDYITSVKEGGFYGWPYAYFGQHEDPRRKGEKPELVKKALVPDVSVGAHTASLGFAFYTAKEFPEKYHKGAFVGQHGSWNRSVLSGYKVLFVPFKDGKPSGEPEDFLTGFIEDPNKNEVHGRPVGVAVDTDGSLLVADDASNTVWRVSAVKND